jgi:hypothetical protein
LFNRGYNDHEAGGTDFLGCGGRFFRALAARPLRSPPVPHFEQRVYVVVEVAR